MNKPSWKDAPPEAEFLSQDGDGYWYWYFSEPKIDHNRCIWRAKPDRWKLASPQTSRNDWKNSLEKRPKETL